MLGLDFFLYVYLGFVFRVFFQVSLGHFVLVLIAFDTIRYDVTWPAHGTETKK